MSTIVNFFVFFILVPLIYLAILFFDFMLIARTKTLINRWRNIAGVFVGFLISVIVIMLDQNYGSVIPNLIGDEYETAWSSAVIFGVIGFLVLLGIDFLLRRGVAAFVIIFTVVGVFLSAYFLISLSSIRTATAVTTIGFLVGVILYFVLFPTRIFNTIRSSEEPSADE